LKRIQVASLAFFVLESGDRECYLVISRAYFTYVFKPLETGGLSFSDDKPVLHLLVVFEFEYYTFILTEVANHLCDT